MIGSGCGVDSGDSELGEHAVEALRSDRRTLDSCTSPSRSSPRPTARRAPRAPRRARRSRAPAPAARRPESAARTSRSPCPARATGARRALRHRLTTAKSRSPSSSSSRAIGHAVRRAALRAGVATSARTSASSSSTFSAGPSTSGQSKPTPAARSCSRKARCSAGRSTGSPSTMLSRFFAFISSHALALTSPYRCGCRAFIFVRKPSATSREVERTALFGDDGVEEHLEQQVAELFAQLRVVAGANRVVDLVRFLDQIRTQRLVRLRRVPVAARAQIAHQRERIFKCRFLLHRSPRRPYTSRPPT